VVYTIGESLFYLIIFLNLITLAEIIIVLRLVFRQIKSLKIARKYRQNINLFTVIMLLAFIVTRFIFQFHNVDYDSGLLVLIQYIIIIAAYTFATFRLLYLMRPLNRSQVQHEIKILTLSYMLFMICMLARLISNFILSSKFNSNLPSYWNYQLILSI